MSFDFLCGSQHSTPPKVITSKNQPRGVMSKVCIHHSLYAEFILTFYCFYSLFKALFIACKSNNTDALLQAIKNKPVDLKLPNTNKVYEGKTRKKEKEKRRKTHTNLKTKQKGYTPLHVACIYNSLDVAKILIRQGADVNASNVCFDIFYIV